MLIISSRKNFDNSDTLESGMEPVWHKYREIDFDTDKLICKLKISEFFNEVSKKRVLLLVHGYNNEQHEVYDAYEVIHEKILNHTKNKYDLVIGYSWPGGNNPLDWHPAKQRANSVARRFRRLIEKLSKKTNSIDIMSHSLGARVVLKALKQTKKEIIIRNYFCMAAAVNDEVLEKNKEFYDSVSKIEKIFVFHSIHDDVLKLAYTIGEIKPFSEIQVPLGLRGSENIQYIQDYTKNIYIINCKKVILSHGQYKRTNAIYQYINRVLSNKKLKKFVTL